MGSTKSSLGKLLEEIHGHNIIIVFFIYWSSIPPFSCGGEVLQLQLVLVGGFNPFEKYQSKWKSSPILVENKNFWKHLPVFVCGTVQTHPSLRSNKHQKKAGTSRQKVDPNLQAEDSWRFQGKGAVVGSCGERWAKKTVAVTILDDECWRSFLNVIYGLIDFCSFTF